MSIDKPDDTDLSATPSSQAIYSSMQTIPNGCSQHGLFSQGLQPFASSPPALVVSGSMPRVCVSSQNGVSQGLQPTLTGNIPNNFSLCQEQHVNAHLNSNIFV